MPAFPRVLKPKSSRLATIRKLRTVWQQVQMLTRLQNRRLYEADAKTQPGATIYVVARVSTRDIEAYRSKKLDAESLLDRIQIKIGHTKSLARRRQRLVHLHFLDGGAQRFKMLCLGIGCGVVHREFWPLAEIGGAILPESLSTLLYIWPIFTHSSCLLVIVISTFVSSRIVSNLYLPEICMLDDSNDELVCSLSPNFRGTVLTRYIANVGSSLAAWALFYPRKRPRYITAPVSGPASERRAPALPTPTNS
ncbi:hypothetical protein B0H12DRAFT_1239229 [Mycena haematopus]|nr:hypothetical protein B0H12DRAFT_1239229 [Mycena haematopus]